MTARKTIQGQSRAPYEAIDGQNAAHRAGEERALPDFIIVGTMKGGTRSLFSYISQHPQAIWASRKEIHYFDRNYALGVHWYRHFFPPVSRLNEAASITGEASPYYMFHPHALNRIYETVPRVKIIILLRNPVDRSISHYFHERRRGREPLPIQEAMNAEHERIDPEYRKLIKRKYYDSPAYQHFSYKKRGVYINQVWKFYNRFKAQQILIVKSEDLFSDSLKTVQQVYAFLNIDAEFVPPDLRPRHVADYAKDLPASLYTYLREYFEPYNRQLYEYLDWDFRW